MKDKPQYEIVNPSVLFSERYRKVEDEGCGARQDAAVCTNGNTDVSCTTETYRGCAIGQTDCADNDGNPDDQCCFGGSGLGPGDNIDHGFCREQDAGYGGFSWCFWGDSNPPYYYY